MESLHFRAQGSLSHPMQLIKSKNRVWVRGYCAQTSTILLISDRTNIVLYHFTLSHWKQAFLELSSRLENEEDKWPELNFISFLSVSVEVLRHGGIIASSSDGSEEDTDCVRLLGDYLEELTGAVTEHCVLAISLRQLLKFYDAFICTSRKHAESGYQESAALMKRLDVCLPKLLLSSAGMVKAVDAVLQDFRKESDCDAVESADNLSRSIIRKVVLLLMKYGCLLEDQG